MRVNRGLTSCRGVTRTLWLRYITELANADAVRAKIIGRKLDAAVIDASTVCVSPALACWMA